jgi:hypothetical protein
MPAKKTKPKKTKNLKKKQIFLKIKRFRKISYPMRQRVIGFKRDFSAPVVALENDDTWNPTLPGTTYPIFNLVRGSSGTNMVLGTLRFSLNMLPGYSEFKNLFQQYKLNAVAVKIYPTTSAIVTQNINDPIGTGDIGTANFQIITWKNETGEPYGSGVFSEALLNQIPAKKTRMFPKNGPYTIICPLNQASATYNQSQTSVEVSTPSGGTTLAAQPYNVDYRSVKPRYISTVEDSTPHYGVNMLFRKLDDSDFDVLSPRLKFIFTLYFSCKGIK